MATSKIQGMPIQSTTISGTYISGSWALEKIGKIVFLQVLNFSSVPTGSFSLGASIPADYRPSGEANFTLTRRNTTAEPIAVSVRADGAVTCYKYGNAINVTAAYNQLLCWHTD